MLITLEMKMNILHTQKVHSNKMYFTLTGYYTEQMFTMRKVCDWRKEGEGELLTAVQIKV